MGYIHSLEDYCQTIITDEVKREKFYNFIKWIESEFDLKLEIKYNQPFFTMQGTFILGLSASKNHFSVAPEVKAMEYFSDEIKLSNYEQTTHLFRIKYKDDINYHLISRIINYNMQDKKDYKKFWRE